MVVTLILCAVVIPPVAGGVVPLVTAQQEEERTSLGENLSGSILSDVLDDGSNDDDVTDDVAEDENDQDAANTGTEDSNQGQIVDQDDVSTFGDDTEDLDAANVAVPLGIPIDVEEEEEEEPSIPTAPPSTTPPDEGLPPPECVVEITADKEIYGPEDVVAITITNTGDVPIEFPNSFLGLEIRNLDTEEVLLLDAQPVVVTFQPGASATFQFTYERLVSEIGTGLISATVPSECSGTVEEVTFRLSTAPPEVEPPIENGKIAFDRGGGPLSEVYVMNADGSEQTNLSNNFGFDGYPSWSPDGTKIAFVSGRDGGFSDIYVMNADGSNPTRLTDNASWDLFPSWSPDGTKIAFARDVGQFLFDIYVMNADGSEQTNLSNNPAGDEKPDWSPDGTKIAFASNREGGDNWEIYVMNANDGSEQTRLTNNPRLDHYPSWSPDGTKIAFMTNDAIYVMNADGSEQTNISSSPAGDSHPDWGPATDSG